MTRHHLRVSKLHRNKNGSLTLCILKTPKEVLWQMVKSMIKCSMKLDFIRVCTVAKIKTTFKDRKT